MFDDIQHPNTKAYIDDRDQLVRFERAMCECSRRLIGEINSFDSQLSHFMYEMRRVRDEIHERLEHAQEKLDRARDKLQSCLDSQREDEDGNLHPSCSWEYGAVDSARRERDKWQDKYDKAQSLISNCESEIDDYHYSGGFFSPSGAKETLRRSAEENTEAAKNKLDEILNAVDDTLGMNMSIDSGNSTSYFPQDYEERITEVEERDEDNPVIEERLDTIVTGLNDIYEKVNDEIDYNIRHDEPISNQAISERFKAGAEKLKEQAEDNERQRILKKIMDDHDERGARERERIFASFFNKSR